MSASRRHFERTFHAFLPFHIAEIEVEVALLLIKLLAGVDDGGPESVGLGEELQHVGHRFHAINVEVVHHSSLSYVGFGHDEAFKFLGSCPDSDGQCAFDGLQMAV